MNGDPAQPSQLSLVRPPDPPSMHNPYPRGWVPHPGLPYQSLGFLEASSYPHSQTYRPLHITLNPSTQLDHAQPSPGSSQMSPPNPPLLHPTPTPRDLPQTPSLDQDTLYTIPSLHPSDFIPSKPSLTSRPAQQAGNNAWYWEPSQLPQNSKVMDPEEPTTATLLNQQSP